MKCAHHFQLFFLSTVAYFVIQYIPFVPIQCPFFLIAKNIFLRFTFKFAHFGIGFLRITGVHEIACTAGTMVAPLIYGLEQFSVVPGSCIYGNIFMKTANHSKHRAQSGVRRLTRKILQ